MSDPAVRRAVPEDAIALAMLDADAWDEGIGDSHHTWRLWIESAFVFVAVEELAPEAQDEPEGEEGDAGVGDVLSRISSKVLATSLRRLGSANREKEEAEEDAPAPVVEPKPHDVQAIRAVALGFPTLEGEIVIHKVLTDPEHRNRGFGRAAMDALLEALDEAGLESFLTVAPQNTAGQWLYRKLGFQAIDRIENYYGPDEDRDIMRRKPVER